MKQSSQKSTRSYLPLLISILIVLSFIGVFAFQSLNQSTPAIASAILPPQNERLNSDPNSGYTINIDEVHTHDHLHVSQVTLKTPAKIVVYLDTAGKRKLLGESAILEAGTTKNLMIGLNATLKDGDVVVVTLESNSGMQIYDSSGMPIQVKKPAGMIMTHFQNEY